MANDHSTLLSSPQSQIRNTVHRPIKGSGYLEERKLYQELSAAVMTARTDQHLGCLLYLNAAPQVTIAAERLEKMLVEIGNRIILCCRPGDFVSAFTKPRLGWAVIIRELAVRDEARLLCERLEFLSISGVLQLNAGVSLFPLQSIRPSILWAKARRDLSSGGTHKKTSRSLASNTLRITLDGRND